MDLKVDRLTLERDLFAKSPRAYYALKSAEHFSKAVKQAQWAELDLRERDMIKEVLKHE